MPWARLHPCFGWVNGRFDILYDGSLTAVVQWTSTVGLGRPVLCYVVSCVRRRSAGAEFQFGVRCTGSMYHSAVAHSRQSRLK